MPRRFWFSELNDPIWTLLDPGTLTADTDLLVVVRRPDRTSRRRTRHDAAGISRRVFAPAPRRRGSPQDAPLGRSRARRSASRMSALLPYVLGTAVLLTLLIACANVAILMIAQWTRREAETAMRSALGASRWRLIRAMVAESVLLASCAGALGILATLCAARDHAAQCSGRLDVLRPVDSSRRADHVRGGDPGRWHPRRHRPGAVETRRLQLDPLRGIATSDRVRQRWSHALVVLEITFTLALLVVTTSMVGGYQRSQSANLGFDVAPLMAVQRGEPLWDFAGAHHRHRAAGTRRGRPCLPQRRCRWCGLGPRQPVSVDSTGANTIRSEQVAIDPTFFTTLGVPMRAGRAFTPRTRQHRGRRS